MTRQAPQSVLERILEHVRRTPEAIALRRCDGGDPLSYRELATRWEQLAAALHAAGVSQGSRVLTISDNGPQTYLSVLACARLGAIAVLADGNLPVATVERFSQLTEPAAMVCTDGARLSLAGPTETLSSIPTLWALGSTGPSAQPALPRPAGNADDPLAMIFTSGTTGEPKAVLLANRTFYAVADILRDNALTWIDWVDGEVAYSPLPATHIGGLWWILNCLMHGGRCITGGDAGASLLELLTVNEVATVCLVPTLLARLVSEVKATGAPIPATLRFLGYGGSRAIASDVRYVEDAGVRTAQVYGLSETGCTALCLPTGPGSTAAIEAGAVGRPYPGVQVHLDGDGSGPHGRPASSGTLWIKSPANMLEYWNNPERTAQTLQDGWVNTGDLLDAGSDGLFYIRGRASEMIICGGVNVAPDEVDRVAASVPGVRDAACYEIADPEFGALVGLAVVAADELDDRGARALKKAIAARYRSEVESAARPSTIVLVTSIPRTQSGKVMRTSLAATIGARGRE
ncbi:fatty acid--CoA ligase FadD10 [Mycobacterium sp. UM_Kg1]|uniref:fatty acid--CoA ligase FadD10 n=1 Tax=Mycobacterium sp. UM_Kg1 TaxID=1545691 RepID=UPI00061B35A9|nr:fatty acid--CoA ligase FadD10 [Mycobacterium sp. UM_Kg1]